MAFNRLPSIVTPTVIPGFPFQVTAITLYDETVSLVINTDSHLLVSEDKNSYEADNTPWGLDTGIALDGLDIGDKIWLELPFDSNGNLLTPFVNSGPVGIDAWIHFPDPIQINIDDPSSSYQDAYFQVIAEITDPELDTRDGVELTQSDSTILKLVQILNTNLQLVGASTTSEADQPYIGISVTMPWSSASTQAIGNGYSVDDKPDIMTPWEFGSNSLSNDFPFKVLVQDNPDTLGAYDYGIVYESKLFNSPDSTDIQTISGLLTSDNPLPTDSGWITWNGSDDLIWLDIQIETFPDSSAVAINSWSNGDEFGGGEVEYDGESPPTQTAARVVIAYITSDSTGKPLIDQRIDTHLQMTGAISKAQTFDKSKSNMLDCVVPTSFPSPEALPEFLQGWSNTDGYYAYLGNGTSSFVGESAAIIQGFEIQVQDETDPNSSSFALVVGDKVTANDLLNFEGNGNSILATWWDFPLLQLVNDTEDAVIAHCDTFASLVLTDTLSDPVSEGAQFIEIDLDVGPEITLHDDAGSTIGLDLTSDPNIRIHIGGDDPTNDTVLSSGDLTLGVDGTIEIGDDGSITLGTGGDTTKYSLGDISMTNATGSISIGATSEDGKIIVGKSKLSNGDLDLGTDPSITLQAGVGDIGDFLVKDSSNKAAWTSFSASTGDMLYFTGTVWYALGIGSEGDVMMVQSGVPAWVTPTTC